MAGRPVSRDTGATRVRTIFSVRPMSPATTSVLMGSITDAGRDAHFTPALSWILTSSYFYVALVTEGTQ